MADSTLDFGEAVFNTLQPTFEPGYKVIFRPQPASSFGNKQPTAAPAFSDPRGILPSNLVPASQISYQLVDEVSEAAIADNPTGASLGVAAGLLGIAAGLALGGLQTTGQVVVNSKASIALICFEGHDVVDLPTANLLQGQKGFIVPDKVFLPIYAGGQFINPGDDLAQKAGLEYIKKSSGNSLVNVAASTAPPLDSLSNSKNIYGQPFSPNLVDVASNEIIVNGGAQFLTYVACDKPLFRDVVYMTSSAIGQGVFSGNQLNLNFAGPFGDPIVEVYRYAFVNTNPDALGTPIFNWRLSETFGVANTKFQGTPQEILRSLSANDRAFDFAEEKNNHYVYNLNDSGDDITTRYPVLPIKQAYSVNFAKAKTSQTNPFFDANFAAKIIPYAKNSSFFESELQVEKIIGLSPEGGLNQIVQDRSFVSPIFALDLDNNARLGLEYALHNFNHTQVFGADPIIVLAATRPATDGITAYYDPCISMVVVYTVEDSIATQRLFNDRKWTPADTLVPDSTLKQFLLGESPERTEGPSAIIPQSTNLNVSVGGTKGSFSIPSGSTVTHAIVIGATAPAKGSTKAAVLQLFSGSAAGATPTFEVEIPTVNETQKNPSRLIAIPSQPYSSFNILNPNGSSLAGFLGAKNTPFLPALPTTIPPLNAKAPDNLDKLSALQLSQVAADNFPIQSENVTGGGLSITGSAYIAFNRLGRIDMAYRPSISNQFLVVRDVCFRVPESLTPSNISASLHPGQQSQTGLPSADAPILLVNKLTKSLYLFYSYKNRLVMKNIPSQVFQINNDGTDPTISQLTSPIEIQIAEKIQRILGTVVYDGNITDRTNGIKGDLAFGTLKLGATPTTTTTNTNTTTPQITHHTACVSIKGYIYSFIQDGQRIRARRSTDTGGTWVDIFLDTTTFLPPVKNAPATNSTSNPVTDADAPSCFYDEATRSIHLFFIVDSCLLTMQIPEETLGLDAKAADASLKKIVPEIIYGKITDNLKSRGISSQKSVINRQTAATTANTAFTEVISPHRVAAARPAGGHLRLFFVDQNKVLRSLISSDDGRLWLSEDQYVSAASKGTT